MKKRSRKRIITITTLSAWGIVLSIALLIYGTYRYEAATCRGGCIKEQVVISSTVSSGNLANTDSPNYYREQTAKSTDEEPRFAWIEQQNWLRLAHNYLDFYLLKGDRENREKAKQYFQQVADLGNPEGQYYSALLYEEDGEIDRALACYISASNQNMAEANHQLGRIYMSNPARQDYQKASKYLYLAVLDHYLPAYRDLALLYASGRGVTKDLDEAIALYRTALKEGGYEMGDYGALADLAAQANHYEEALRFYYRAVGKDEAHAFYSLAHFYDQVLALQPHLDRDQRQQFLERAQHFYQMAIEKGDGVANYALAMLLMYGFGVAPHYEEAQSYLLQALRIRETQAESLYQLATLYQLGLGVAPDSRRAIQYIETAVTFNHPDAAYQLGSYYLFGYGGLLPDADRAYQYFTLAKRLGDANLQRSVDSLFARYYPL